ncbi:MAG: hypothetical protein M3P30_02630 [Chloroflexota bacterium]|nr:hypothetical protein [Chloroflexota bacterium]
MPQSVFVCSNTCSIDFITPSSTYANIGDVGVYIGSGIKSILRRALATFDVFGAAASGVPLLQSDTITLAETLCDVIGVFGPTFQVDTERLSRADYLASEATWNNYRAPSPWTAGGGDVAVPPAAVAFTSPSGTGDQALQSNLAPFVADAVANRGGLVLLRWKAQDENPGVTALYSVAASPSHTPPLRLRVTYLRPQPSPIDRLEAGALPGATAMVPERPAGASPAAHAARPEGVRD